MRVTGFTPRMSLENPSCRYGWEIYSIIPSSTSVGLFWGSNLLANELGSRSPTGAQVIFDLKVAQNSFQH